MISEQGLEEATKLYKKTLETKLIDKFKKEFYEKIGYVPQVITMNDEVNELYKLELQEIIDIINDIMEEEFGDRRVGKHLLRITSPTRKRDVTEYRYIYFKIARLMGYTYVEIGFKIQKGKLKGYDHTTVMHGIKTFDDLLSTNQKFALRYQNVVDNIKLKYNKVAL